MHTVYTVGVVYAHFYYRDLCYDRIQYAMLIDFILYKPLNQTR